MKANEQAQKHNLTVVCLIPATPDAGWFDICLEADEIRFITGEIDDSGSSKSGRISFVDSSTNKEKNGNSKGSMLVIFKRKISTIFHEPKTRYISRELLKSLS